MPFPVLYVFVFPHLCCCCCCRCCCRFFATAAFFFLPLSFSLSVVALFQEKFGRRPLPADTPECAAVIESALEKNGLPPDFLGEAGHAAGGAAASLCATATAEISPVCAILGGILGQEVSK